MIPQYTAADKGVKNEVKKNITTTRAFHCVIRLWLLFIMAHGTQWLLLEHLYQENCHCSQILNQNLEIATYISIFVLGSRYCKCRRSLLTRTCLM